MKTVVVTGGAGFLGSHLCDLLFKKNFKVIAVDNLITGSEKNIEHLIGKNNFTFIKADIINAIDKLASESFDYLFHLASPASPIDYWKYPEETLLVNSQGTINMLRLVIKKKAQFLLASTSEIYGDPEVHPQPESYFGNVNTFGPRSCYDESKRFAETSVYVFYNKYKINARIIRIFNTYGPRMQKDDGRVISNFINQALTNSDITIDGDGSQTRSFCYVSDLIEGIYKAMFTVNTSGKVINLGNPKEFTIKELAEKVINLTNSKSQIAFSGKFRTNDPMKRKPDIAKAKKFLNWQPKINLNEGLKKTIEYYKSL